MDFDGRAAIELHGKDWYEDVQRDIAAFNHFERARQDSGIDIQYNIITSLCKVVPLVKVHG